LGAGAAGALLAGALLVAAGAAVPAGATAARPAAAGGAARQGATGQAGPAPGLSGSWVLTRPDSTNRVLLTFTPDGGVVVDTQPSHPVDPPQEGVTRHYQSAGHGAWERDPDGVHHLTFLFLEYDQDGRHILLLKVRGQLVLDPEGQTWSMVERVQILDRPGTTVVQEIPPRVANGTRIRVER
jgi:hypothetical protein